jgi:hypothetical protein
VSASGARKENIMAGTAKRAAYAAALEAIMHYAGRAPLGMLGLYGEAAADRAGHADPKGEALGMLLEGCGESAEALALAPERGVRKG